jgi:hypothetical protein
VPVQETVNADGRARQVESPGGEPTGAGLIAALKGRDNLSAASPPRLPPRHLVAMQTMVGNRAVAGTIATGRDRAGAGGDPGPVVQRQDGGDGGAPAGAPGTGPLDPLISRAGPPPVGPPPSPPPSAAASLGTGSGGPGGAGTGAGPGGAGPGNAGGGGKNGAAGGSTPAPATTPAPPPSANVNPPTAQNPSSGTDWHNFFTGDEANWVRTPLELLRVVPELGLVTGAISDLMNLEQDRQNLAGQDAPITKTLMVVRDVLALVNNAVGHVKYCTQLAEDGVTISVVLSELDAILGPLTETESGVKVVMDEAQLMLDTALLATAKYQMMHAPPGPAAEAWKNMVNTYMVDGIGDLVTMFMDFQDLVSAGALQGGVGQQVVNEGKWLIPRAKIFKAVFIQWIQGLNGIWGSKIPFAGAAGGGGGGAPAAQRKVDASVIVQRDGGASPVLTSAVADAIITELTQVKSAYDIGTALVTMVSAAIQQDLAEMDQVATALNGGADPVKQLQAKATDELTEMSAKIALLQELITGSATAEDKATAISASCDAALETINAVTVPHLAPSGASDGVVGQITAAALAAFSSKLQAAVDEAKSAVSGPIQSLKANAADIAQFFTILQQTAADQVAWINDHVADFTARLAQCNSLPDVMNLMLHEVSQAMGLETDLDVAGLQADWAELGTSIDSAIDWAQQLKAAASQPASQGPTTGAPPATPPNGGGGTGGNGGGGPAPAPTAQQTAIQRFLAYQAPSAKLPPTTALGHDRQRRNGRSSQAHLPSVHSDGATDVPHVRLPPEGSRPAVDDVVGP